MDMIVSSTDTVPALECFMPPPKIPYFLLNRRETKMVTLLASLNITNMFKCYLEDPSNWQNPVLTCIGGGLKLNYCV